MKNKSRLTLLFFCVITLALGLLSGFGIGSSHIMGVAAIKLGLDLKGGVTILYEAKKNNPTSEELNAANALLRRRLDAKNYTEATTGRESDKYIRVNIPGVDDPRTAVSEIGRTALLTFEDEEGNILLTGNDVARASRGVISNNAGSSQIVVNLEFTSDGARKFEQATRENQGKKIYIYMDDEMISDPVVNNPITDGRCYIEGGLNGFSAAQAEELASAIREGSLPFELEPVDVKVVGAQLGAKALESGIIAGIIGILLVLASMLVIYRLAGLAADISLLIYTALLLIIVSLLGITLTLPGIAGIILSVGMALDANVVIFERIREEIKTGRTLRSAVKAGFKRAFPAILDCNITTLIAAAALFWKGTGPIQGFAVMLAIGILVSMFSALVLTKIILLAFVDTGLRNPKMYGITESVNNPADTEKPAKVFGILKWRKRCLMLSAGVLVIGIAFMLFFYSRGSGLFNMSVDFASGASFEIDIDQPFENDDIAEIIRQVTGQTSPQIQKVINEDKVLFKIRLIDDETHAKLEEALTERYDLTPEDITYDIVSPTVSAEMQVAALAAIALACGLMLVYITLRFRDVRMGVSTVLTLLHDALLTVAVYAVLRIPLSYSFIAVLLTVIGYSINATIIIFDRIRENKSNLRNPDSAELVNTSVTQTLRRSLLTSGTTMLVVLGLYIFGVPSIKDFTLPIIIGLFFGTYSSVFLSGAFWYMLGGAAPSRKKS